MTTRLTCRILGHQPVFRADGTDMHWECSRGCIGGHGSKQYPTAEHAQRYAARFNRRDTDELGKRAPLLGMFPLRLWRRMRRTGR